MTFPEMLARENKGSTADLLKEWVENEDGHLRERKTKSGNAGGCISSDHLSFLFQHRKSSIRIIPISI